MTLTMVLARLPHVLICGEGNIPSLREDMSEPPQQQSIGLVCCDLLPRVGAKRAVCQRPAFQRPVRLSFAPLVVVSGQIADTLCAGCQWRP